MSNMFSSVSYPLTVQALRVSQPLGVFYVVALPATVLLDTAYSDRLRAVRSADGNSYELEGSQRELLIPRLKEIGHYIASEESTFPNSIILAPNFYADTGQAVEDTNVRWRVDEVPNTSAPNGAIFTLTIPSREALAPIIDGQHRLYGFNYCENPSRLNEELVCSVFIDLPKPFQAFLFATINSNQKPVSKSQTYDLFGYNVEKEPAEAWSPDKLAVFLARKLNTEHDSPLLHRLLIAADNDFTLSRSQAKLEGKWMVSMAVMVEGICRLFSQNSKRDRITLMKLPVTARSREALARNAPSDKSPLRSLYLEANDKLIHAAVKNFFIAVDRVFWQKSPPNSFISKTVGIQALFDVLVGLAQEGLAMKTFSEQFFERHLARAGDIDFASEIFQNASGSGRQFIKNCLFIRLGLKSPDGLSPEQHARIATALNHRW